MQVRRGWRPCTMRGTEVCRPRRRLLVTGQMCLSAHGGRTPKSLRAHMFCVQSTGTQKKAHSSSCFSLLFSQFFRGGFASVNVCSAGVRGSKRGRSRAKGRLVLDCDHFHWFIGGHADSRIWWAVAVGFLRLQGRTTGFLFLLLSSVFLHCIFFGHLVCAGMLWVLLLLFIRLLFGLQGGEDLSGYPQITIGASGAALHHDDFGVLWQFSSAHGDRKVTEGFCGCGGFIRNRLSRRRVRQNICIHTSAVRDDGSVGAHASGLQTLPEQDIVCEHTKLPSCLGNDSLEGVTHIPPVADDNSAAIFVLVRVYGPVHDGIQQIEECMIAMLAIGAECLRR
mmetsp:Transcript_17358/g.50673  ORF Transcript_17358/g.50673 Transcript_17358/m.50673 type:complete len:337 (+) Transcript_17358:451-1461(+)